MHRGNSSVYMTYIHFYLQELTQNSELDCPQNYEECYAAGTEGETVRVSIAEEVNKCC